MFAEQTYTGIGSRTLPDDIESKIYFIGRMLGELGWTLRSGGANGADITFEKGCDLAKGKKEIFLPWKGFNNNQSSLYEIPEEADAIAKKFYTVGNYNRLKPTTKKFMQRNVMQVMGESLCELSSFVVCWTKDGCENGKFRTRDTGGTGQAISIASAYGIPIYNLNNKGRFKDLLEYILLKMEEEDDKSNL